MGRRGRGFAVAVATTVFLIVVSAGISRADMVPWWNLAYRYRVPMAVQNNGTMLVKAHYPVGDSFETKSLVSAGKVQESGNDLRIVWYDGLTSTEVDRHPLYMNSDSTEIWFSTIDDIGPGGADNSYWLYYGNPDAPEWQDDWNTVFAPHNDPDTRALWHLETGSGIVALDSSGHANHGALLNMGEESWSRGRFGLGLVFDGVNDRVHVDGDSSLAVDSGITLEGFVWLPSYFSGFSNSGDLCLYDKGNYTMWLDCQTGRLVFELADCAPANWALEYDTPSKRINCFARYGQKLYAGSGDAGLLYTYDGATWTSQDLTGEADIQCLAIYDGKLYAGTGSYLLDGGGKIYVYDGSIWSLEYDTPSKDIFCMAVYNGKLYAGSGDAGVVYIYDGTTWTSKDISGDLDIQSMAVYDGKLYAGTGVYVGTGGKGEIRVYDGTSWSMAYDTPSKDIFCMSVYCGKLYAGSGDMGLVYTYDGMNWKSEDITAQNDVESFAVYDGKLYAGTGKFLGGAGIIYVCDEVSWSLAYDSAIKDVLAMCRYKGKLYVGGSDQGRVERYGNNEFLWSGRTFWLGQRWFHVAGTYDGSAMKIYIDGAQNAFKTATLTCIETSDKDLHIGCDYSKAYFNGRVDGLAISSVSKTSFPYAGILPDPVVSHGGEEHRDDTPPEVGVTVPNGGEMYLVSDTVNIQWLAIDEYGVDSINIFYTTNAGYTWMSVAHGLHNSSSYPWIVPDSPSDSCLVKIAAFDPSLNQGSDESDGLFMIHLTGITEETCKGGLLQKHALLGHWPNPFETSTTISYVIPGPGSARVSLKVYDTAGRVVRSLMEGEKPSGQYATPWDGRDRNGRDVVSGIYFCHYEIETTSVTEQMVLIR
jgi:hypothetical protein